MTSEKTLSLLIEIGCEEIPARFLEGAENDLKASLGAALEGLNANGEVKIYSTPRRLVAHMPSLRAKLPGRTQTITGPPVNVALGPDGKYSRAAEGFAAKNNKNLSELKRVKTTKGEYFAIEVTEPGQSALEALVDVLPTVITGLSFPKSMCWEESKTRWVRPIRWILALLGEGDRARVIPFEVAGVKAGNLTYGHRVLGPGPAEVTGFKDYVKKLQHMGVEFDPAKRRELVRTQCKEILEDFSLRLVSDNYLEDWVVNSCEWPIAILGSFDTLYQVIPREILVTVMRDHQKYFAVENQHGVLQSRFVTILNTDSSKIDLIRQGHERVLAARFRDALFFLNADHKVSLRQRYEDGWLNRVTYQAKLGSYSDKVRRMEAIANGLCETLREQQRLTNAQEQHALQAVQLCKCDLTTQMVQEFPELQGIVGGLYLQNTEPQEVWQAVYDHYKPQGTEDSCPRSVVGAVASLSDKLDSIVSAFAAGLEPTGSSDPFGLRRAGNGAVKLCVEALPGVDVCAIAGVALGQIQQGLSRQQQDAWPKIVDFFRERLEFYLREVLGLSYDTARSVLAPAIPDAWNVPLRAVRRAQALEQVRSTPDYIALATSAKRTRNILTKSVTGDDERGPEGLSEAKLIEEPERELYRSYRKLLENLDRFENDGDYEGGLREIAAIRPAVDLFFDKVLVMAEDPDIRRNRVQLLIRLNADVFSRFADLSELAAEARGGEAAKSGQQVSAGDRDMASRPTAKAEKG